MNRVDSIIVQLCEEVDFWKSQDLLRVSSEDTKRTIKHNENMIGQFLSLALNHDLSKLDSIRIR